MSWTIFKFFWRELCFRECKWYSMQLNKQISKTDAMLSKSWCLRVVWYGLWICRSCKQDRIIGQKTYMVVLRMSDFQLRLIWDSCTSVHTNWLACDWVTFCSQGGSTNHCLNSWQGWNPLVEKIKHTWRACNSLSMLLQLNTKWLCRQTHHTSLQSWKLSKAPNP